MIFRAVCLSLALIFGIAAIIPLTIEFTNASSVSKTRKEKKKSKKYKKYSKKWWRAYHRRVRAKKAAAARRRMLRLRRIRLAQAKKTTIKQPVQQSSAGAALESGKPFIFVQGKIKKVLDGDTVKLAAKDGQVYLIRMLGVEAPQINRAFGAKSQKKLSNLILGKDVSVIIRKKDSSRRYLGTVYYSGEDINLKQIETGMAVYLQQNGNEPIQSDREIYEQAAQKARTGQKGLWSRQKSYKTLAYKR